MTADNFIISKADSLPCRTWFQLGGSVTLTEEDSDAATSHSKKGVGG